VNKRHYKDSPEGLQTQARQIFSGLGCGLRPHRSITYYGFSYLVLNPALKTNAMYYPGDTSYIATFNTIDALTADSLKLWTR
jgi:hypothetical protein